MFNFEGLERNYPDFVFKTRFFLIEKKKRYGISENKFKSSVKNLRDFKMLAKKKLN